MEERRGWGDGSGLCKSVGVEMVGWAATTVQVKMATEVGVEWAAVEYGSGDETVTKEEVASEAEDQGVDSVDSGE